MIQGHAGREAREEGLTYILGLPFSGSSLFALSLGNAPGFVNCGEMNYLGYDWRQTRKCSCGAALPECPFWGPIARESAKRAAEGQVVMRLDDDVRPHAIDLRYPPLLRRLALLLGRSPRRVYGSASVDRYVAEHLNFVTLVRKVTGAREVIDASKNTRRLELFAAKADEPVRVIVISRRPEDALGARIKRARRRNPRYRAVLSPLFTFWLLQQFLQMRRALSRIPHDRVFRLRYEDFVSDPEKIERELSEWYGRRVTFGRDGPRSVSLADVHVYTGNNWITRDSTGVRSVTLRPPRDTPELTRFERAQFRLFAALLPILRKGV
jgi:hypothetical protein